MISPISHPNFLLFCLILTLFSISATVEAQDNVRVGDSLSANDENLSWDSAQGHFAFGFLPISGQKDRFILAIWYAKIPDRTIVWCANRENPAVERGSKLELINTGHLVLKDPKGGELWRSQSVDNDLQVSHAAMLDTGNFVIASGNSTVNIWESFKNPTDTILPTQELDVNGSLVSASSEKSYKDGKYHLRFNGGSLMLNQIDMFTGKRYNGYYIFGDASRLIFNQSGYIQIRSSNGSLTNIAPEKAVPNPDSTYYRATLDFYGVFTLYSYPKNPSNGENWFAMWFKPQDICGRMIDPEARLGNGPCGYNSVCEAMFNGRPNCSCPPGFSFLDEANQYAGCKQDYVNYPRDCNPDGSTIEGDQFEFRSMQYADFPFSDYGILQPATESECKQSCLLDCSCAVAILQDPSMTKDGSGTCWKKKLPLLNGRFNREIDRTALFKVPKSDGSRKSPDDDQSSDDENENQAVLILAVLLGTSAMFNCCSLAAISLLFFCLYRRKQLRGDLTGTRRDLETNLRCFTYKDLEQATNRFKEEVGKGAFGTVYKGELSSSYGDYVAVKKLDKLVQEGEREFKTEVKVIGQTHHKNLVRLLGYCDDLQHRLLVYEYMQNGSLSSFLFGVIRPSWQQRVQIALGIAKGLTYLHEECSKQIIHCDIKPQNILLDDSFTAKISDFGLAKLLINNNTRTLTGIRGTKGYVAPEWFRNKPVTVKVDVYSFGVMLLEIISCRRCVEVEMEEAAILTEWAYDCYSEGRVGKLVENDEEARSDVGKLEMWVKVAIWCVQEEPTLRPSMRTVSMMLDGAVKVPTPPCPFQVNSLI